MGLVMLLASAVSLLLCWAALKELQSLREALRKTLYNGPKKLDTKRGGLKRQHEY
ncbi:MAG: hypothetical protein ACPL5F_13705 [Moorellaceae bacterium]